MTLGFIENQEAGIVWIGEFEAALATAIPWRSCIPDALVARIAALWTDGVVYPLQPFMIANTTAKRGWVSIFDNAAIIATRRTLIRSHDFLLALGMAGMVSLNDGLAQVGPFPTGSSLGI